MNEKKNMFSCTSALKLFRFSQVYAPDENGLKITYKCIFYCYKLDVNVRLMGNSVYLMVYVCI